MPGPSPSGTRRRLVTSCSECHRRKQKCDRGQPCNFCIRRGVPAKCSYSHEHRRQSARAHPYHTPSDVGDTVFAHDSSLVPSPTPSTEYVDTIGYPVADGARHCPTPTTAGSTRQLRRHPQRYAHHILHGGSPQAFSRRYRLALAELPAHTVLVELVAVFFAEVNDAAQILERCYFDTALVEWLTLTATTPQAAVDELPRHVVYFPLLVFQVLAMALHFLPEKDDEIMAVLPVEFTNPEGRRELAQKYSSLGEELMTLLGRQGSTTCGVEHDILRAYWLKTTGKGTAAWHLLGTAIRQAQDQCLHLRRRPQAESHGTTTELWYEEYRRRLWATLFNWDSHMSLTLNRPRAISPSDCTIERPLDCDFPADPAVATFPRASNPQDPPSLLAIKLLAYDLGAIIHKVFTPGAHQKDPASHAGLVSYSDEVSFLLSQLHPSLRHEIPDTSLDHLHPQIRPQRQYIRILANSFLLSLHRDHHHHHHLVQTDSRNKAIESALAVLEAQEQILSPTASGPFAATAGAVGVAGSGRSAAAGTCAYYYSMSCYTMDASIFLSHALSMSSSSVNSHAPQQYPRIGPELEARARHALHRSIEALQILRQRSPLAECGVRILSAAVGNLSRDVGVGNGGGVAVGSRGKSADIGLQQQQQQQHQNPLLATSAAHPSPPNDDNNDRIAAVTLGNRLQQDVFEDLLLNDSLPGLFSVDFLDDAELFGIGAYETAEDSVFDLPSIPGE